MGMPTPAYYTAEMVRAFPEDGNKYELVYGELLVSPAPQPWHEVVQFRLRMAIAGYLQREPIGHLFGPLADISWDEAVLVSPDILVVPLDEARTLDWAQMQHLMLIAEVLSPSTARFDRFTKRRRYQEADVPLYWIVDPDKHQVEVWTPTDSFPRFERERLLWHPAGATESLLVELNQLFQPI
jgi:Uma2 family endonuclease